MRPLQDLAGLPRLTQVLVQQAHVDQVYCRRSACSWVRLEHLLRRKQLCERFGQVSQLTVYLPDIAADSGYLLRWGIVAQPTQTARQDAKRTLWLAHCMGGPGLQVQCRQLKRLVAEHLRELRSTGETGHSGPVIRRVKPHPALQQPELDFIQGVNQFSTQWSDIIETALDRCVLLQLPGRPGRKQSRLGPYLWILIRQEGLDERLRFVRCAPQRLVRPLQQLPCGRGARGPDAFHTFSPFVSGHPRRHQENASSPADSSPAAATPGTGGSPPARTDPRQWCSADRSGRCAWH